jgi:hypothetical protein
MSIYTTKLTKALRKEVFSGNPVPEEWMPEGTWHPGADYICLVLKNSVAPGAFKFVSAGKNLVRAVPVVPVEVISSRSDVFQSRRDHGDCGDHGDHGDHEESDARPDTPVAQNAKERGKKTVTITPETLKAVCDKLESLLLEDDAEAVDVLDANAELLDAAFPNHSDVIGSSIRSFNFEAALNALRTATATLA